MPTYEEEHGLNSTNNNTEGERPDRLTVQQALNNFINTPTDSRNNLSNSINNSINGINNVDFNLLNQMMNSMNTILVDKSDTNTGVSNEFIDRLERVNVKQLKNDDTCPICTNEYKDDSYPLVVELPCNSKHRFDLECIVPWLKINKTCPLCRIDVTIKKELPVLVDSEEEDEDWEMYG